MAQASGDNRNRGSGSAGAARDGALAFAFYLLLTLALTYPLARGLGSAVLGTPGDNLEYIWKIWRFHHRLGAGLSPFTGGDVFAAWHYSPLSDETSLSQVAPSLPLSWLFGDIAAYNLLVLLSFPLSGLAMWLLLRHFTGSALAALFAGAIFAFCPYHVVHAQGHWPLMGLYWVPLLFLALEKAIEARSAGWALLTGLFYSFAALSSWYYAYMWGLFAVIYVLMRARQMRRRLFGLTALRLSALAALPMLVLVGPMSWATWLALRQQAVRHGVSAFIIYSASPLDFVGGFPWQLLWGGWVQRLIGPGAGLAERGVFVGLVPLVLAFVGRRQSRAARLYALTAVLGAVIALGPVLQWRGRPVAISVSRPQALRAGLQRCVRGIARFSGRNVPPEIAELRAVPIPTPALAAIVALRGFGSLRAIGRFGLAAVLGVSVLAGFGLARLVKPMSRRRRWLMTAALLAAAIFEFWPGRMPVCYPKPSRADLWLAKQPGNFVVAALPAARNSDGQMLYGAIHHRKRLLGGRATIPPQGFEQSMALLDDLPSPQALQFLRRSRVRYLVVHGRAGGPLEEALGRGQVADAPKPWRRGAPALRLAWRGDAERVYRVLDR